MPSAPLEGQAPEHSRTVNHHIVKGHAELGRYLGKPFGLLLHVVLHLKTPCDAGGYGWHLG